jgi:RNA polymerase sigma-70 factor (ECF subfamily)
VTQATESIADLVRAARRGERAALAALASRHLRAAVAVALAVLRRPADAEDVAQEAFVVAIEKLDECREPERFSGWLMQIVRRRALNALEARKLRDVAPTENAAEIAIPPPEAGTQARLLAALAALTPVQREVVLLHDLEGWTHAEIADAVGTSELMSRQHLFAARRELRRRLAPEDAPEMRHGR